MSAKLKPAPKKRPARVIPLITLQEFKSMWEVLTALLDAGGLQEDLATHAYYVRLQAKLATKAGIVIKKP